MKYKQSSKNRRVCSKGHTFYKSSSCPVCPFCENERKPDNELLNILGAPARRALENAGINSWLKLAAMHESEILQLHGMGPSSIPKLRKGLKANGLSFKTDND